MASLLIDPSSLTTDSYSPCMVFQSFFIQSTILSPRPLFPSLFAHGVLKLSLSELREPNPQLHILVAVSSPFTHLI